MRTRHLVPLVLFSALWLGLLAPPASAGQRWTWPLSDHSIAREFAPPAHDYGPGHRGVDLAGSPGETVRAVAAGTVAFVGQVGGRPVVTVSHGAERSTYLPVAATVEVGDAVRAGEPIGTLLAGHTGCGAAACLHLGRLEGETYLDPAELLGGRYQLIDPDGPVPEPPLLGDGTLAPPVEGPVTSAFGMRVHPVTGVYKLHDGVDFGAPCGTPVVAAAAGSVRLAGSAGAYGTRVEVDHGGGLVTSYSHLTSTSVSVGSTVSAGQKVGAVGTTGSSTGCHLHFSVQENGQFVDPAPLL
ncbi:MAG: peptidoglycan DD-metalloendopeptidase family protein [Aeromicrobium sp.]|uniref:peptidoglycan DD-metalloendopeptidase family protein n=1 Tax=Aeromicrobium sp. TaxID=1871063 RepID=UPI0039E52471